MSKIICSHLFCVISCNISWTVLCPWSE